MCNRYENGALHHTNGRDQTVGKNSAAPACRSSLKTIERERVRRQELVRARARSRKRLSLSNSLHTHSLFDKFFTYKFSLSFLSRSLLFVFDILRKNVYVKNLFLHGELSIVPQSSVRSTIRAQSSYTFFDVTRFHLSKANKTRKI